MWPNLVSDPTLYFVVKFAVLALAVLLWWLVATPAVI